MNKPFKKTIKTIKNIFKNLHFNIEKSIPTSEIKLIEGGKEEFTKHKIHQINTLFVLNIRTPFFKKIFRDPLFS